MAGKLTAKQRELLYDIEIGSCAVSQTYEPAKKLVALGLAEWKQGKFSDFLQITPAGRTALEDKP
jgi:hypothetical protein